MQNITFKVSGMSCMGCVNSVKRLLTALTGVGSVEVDLGAGRVDVSFDPGQVQVDAMRSAIESGGYQVLA
jgi:copper chaperone